MQSFRRLALVLMAMLSRPWTWLVLGTQFVMPLTLLLMILTSRWETLTRIEVVSGPTVVRKSGAALGEDHLPTVTEWYAVFQPNPDRRERLGDWDIMDRLPALERLWMDEPDCLSDEGWRRIGDHDKLELLSLRGIRPMHYTVGDKDFVRDGRDALARLTRLKYLELRNMGSERGILLPPLPALEVCSIDWMHLEENVAALATGLPRLQVLALETYPQFEFTPGMLAALEQMPALHTVYVAAAPRRCDEPAMARQVAELQRALPWVSIRPGYYSRTRASAVAVATYALAGICWVFWFQAATLLATPLGWMLPRRFPPHAVWPIAVAAAGGTALVILCRTIGVAWLPAVGLALFAGGVGLSGPVFGDLAGWPARLTRLAVAAGDAGGLLIWGTFIGAPATADRWLMGYEPTAAVAFVVVAAASLGWKIVRLARLPRIVAEGGVEATLFGGYGGGLFSAPASARSPADQRDLSWWLNDAAFDRQLVRRQPTARSAAGWFADMIRRPQSHLQAPLTVGVVMAGVVAVAWIRMAFTGGSPIEFARRMPGLLVAAAVQATAVAFATTAGLWWQRRTSLVLDFLRPVSRHDYWLGLRAAVARDLILAFAIVAAGLMVAVSFWGQGRLLPWVVSALALGGAMAVTHVMLLLVAVARRPLVTGTIAVMVFVAAAFGLVGVVGAAVAPVRFYEGTSNTLALAGAVLMLVAGLAIRAAVLWKLEDREIG
jgi:hypothetical protein